HLLSRLEGEEVEAALERRDPPIEDCVRRDLLPAEVVDDQEAAVGEHLERRAIEAGVRVVTQLELLERELAADHDGRTTAADPPPIGTRHSFETRSLVSRWKYLVVDGV